MRAADVSWAQWVKVQPEMGRIELGSSRALLVDAEAMGLLRRELVETLGQKSARGVLTRFGFAHGANSAESMSTMPWSDVSEWRRAGGRLHTLLGMVWVEPVPRHPEEEVPFAEALWRDSYEAQQHLKFFGRAEEPVCWTLCGFSSGYLSRANGRRVYCFEVKCVGKGDAVCQVVGKFGEQLNDHEKELAHFYENMCLHSDLQRMTQELKRTENRLRARRQALSRFDVKEATETMSAHSVLMRHLLHSAHRAARVDWSVHFSGPSGVGKERLARLIHEESDRSLGPFLSIHCASMEPNLLEHELFGVGGLIESSAGGTLFLDCVEDMAPSVQERLWHYLSSRGRVGVGQPRPPRWMTASECSWEKAVSDGRFRSDLFEKLRGMELRVPPLKDRPDDILPLARAFVVEAATRFHRRVRGFSAAASEKLLSYAWPGNVAELKAAMEYAVLMAATEMLEKENLPESVQHAVAPSPLRRPIATLEEVEHQHIQWVLDQNEGNREETARQLGIGIATLYRKLKHMKHKGTPVS